jgi:hypothetical protein
MLRKYDTKVQLPILVVSGIISVSLFMGLFFGLNYPEIKQQENPASICTITWKQHEQKYVCKKDCSICSDANTTHSCEALINLGNSFSPFECQQNYTKCPPIGSSCNDGYKCCAVCKNICCVFTTKLQCSLSCLIFSKIIIGVSFNVGNISVDSQIETQFNNDLASSHAFYVKYSTGLQFRCQYDTSNHSNVIIDPGYTTWKWIVTGIAMACVLTCLILSITFVIRFIISKIRYRYGVNYQ